MRQHLDGIGAAFRSGMRRAAVGLVVAIAVLPLAAWTGLPALVVVQHSVTGPIASGIHGKCLADRADSSGHGLVVDINQCNGRSTQRWTVPADNTLRILGKCLQASRKSAAAGLVLASCNGSRAQFWEVDGIVRVPGVELLNPWSGRCMEDPKGSTVDGTQVRLGDCSRSKAQTWYPPPSKPHALAVPRA